MEMTDEANDKSTDLPCPSPRMLTVTKSKRLPAVVSRSRVGSCDPAAFAVCPSSSRSAVRFDPTPPEHLGVLTAGLTQEDGPSINESHSVRLSYVRVPARVVRRTGPLTCHGINSKTLCHRQFSELVCFLWSPFDPTVCHTVDRIPANKGSHGF